MDVDGHEHERVSPRTAGPALQKAHTTDGCCRRSGCQAIENANVSKEQMIEMREYEQRFPVLFTCEFCNGGKHTIMDEAGGADVRGASSPSSHTPAAKPPPPPVVRTPWQLFRLHLVLLTWKNGVLQTRRPVSAENAWRAHIASRLPDHPCFNIPHHTL